MKRVAPIIHICIHRSSLYSLSCTDDTKSTLAQNQNLPFQEFEDAWEDQPA